MRTSELESKRRVCTEISNAILLDFHLKLGPIGAQNGLPATVRAVQNKYAIVGVPQFLLPNGEFKDGKTSEQFEKDLVLDFSNQKHPVANDYMIRRKANSEVTYYVAVRAKQNCFACHHDSSGASHVGDLMAVIKLDTSKSPYSIQVP